MAHEWKPLFSDGVSHTWGLTPTGTVAGEKVVVNDLPSADNRAALYFVFPATTATLTLTPRVEFFIGPPGLNTFGTDSGWSGVHHSLVNGWRMTSGSAPGEENGTTASPFKIITSTSQETYGQINLYEQPWWRPNNGFRVHLKRESVDEAITFYAVAIIL
jgi:hypothetical protein